MADSVEQLYKAQDLQEKLYPITKENAVKDNSNVSLDTKLTSINTSISNKVDKVTGKGLSTNDYTSAEKTKLAGIEAGAQVNVLEAVKINNTALPITNKAVNITIDSAVSETSTNAVQNKTIKSYVDTAKEEVKEDISNSVLENLTSGSSLKLYAQETLADQEFLYRQSPTEEDGNAKITDIKGNTLVWNQIAQLNQGVVNTCTKSYDDTTAITTITPTSYESNNVGLWNLVTTSNLKNGHKYYVSIEVKPDHDVSVTFGFGQNIITSSLTSGKFQTVRAILTWTASSLTIYARLLASGWTSGTFQIKNVQCIDLTQMGLDSITADEFIPLFSKPYYDYCQGAMLSFGGRNVKFNQLVRNGNFESISGWEVVRGTPTASNNVLSYRVDALGGGGLQNRIVQNISIPANHKVFYNLNINPPKAFSVIMNIGIEFVDKATTVPNTWNLCRGIRTLSSAMTYFRFGCPSTVGNMAVGDVIQFKNVMLVDLTEMFGAGNEPSVEGFRELFPNDYYEYTTGKYMNIGQPVSLKTVGFNQWDEEWEHGSLGNNGENTGSSASPEIRSTNYIPIVQNASYYLNVPAVAVVHYYGSADLSDYKGNQYIASAQLLNIPNGTKYIRFRTIGSYGDYKNDICLNINDPSRNGEYEPYTESTLSIPLDEFPNGMDGIGDAKDEKNETGYVKRIGELNIGSSMTIATWESNDGWTANIILNTYKPNGAIKSDKFEYIGSFVGASAFATSAKAKGGYCLGSLRDANRLYFYSSSATTSNELINVIRGTNLYYELATPLENYGVVDLGTLDWIYNDSFKRFHSTGLSSLAKFPSSDTTVANILSNEFATVSAVYFNNNKTVDKLVALSMYGSIYARNLSMTDVNEFKSSLSGVYLLYEKVNPQGSVYPPQSKDEYPFFKSYKGGTEQILPENSSIPTTAPIIADIEYSYDFKAVDRIIGMLNSVAQNETSPSTHNYSVGDYLVYKYQLYKVIASISTGASLTVGTNIQATTIMNELASLS